VGGLRPTRVWLLVVVAIAAAVAAFLASDAWYADVPSPPSYAPVWLAVLALAEGYTAFVTRARLAGRPGTKPIEPIVVARLAALAKASSLVGSVFVGAYAGFFGTVARTESFQAHADRRTAIVGVACSLALVAAGLGLEQVCRARRPRDDDPTAGG
jgi:hypothetical protein